MFDEDTQFGSVFALLRVAYGYGQGRMAAILDKDQSYISRLESNERIPSWELLATIAEEFDIPIYLIVYMLEYSNGCLCDENESLEQEVGKWVLEALKEQIDDTKDDEE